MIGYYVNPRRYQGHGGQFERFEVLDHKGEFVAEFAIETDALEFIARKIRAVA